MDEIARHYETGRWVRLSLHERTIASLDELPQHDGFGDSHAWIAPAFWDIQLNGRWGISFSDPGLTTKQVVEIVLAQAVLGTARLCPTLITAPRESLLSGVSMIARACEANSDVARRIVGIHLEGPYISEQDGYRGAHPRDSVRDPDWGEIQRLQDASGGRIIMITLAPERQGAIAFIERAAAEGIKVAIGHTAADGPTLRAAAAAGACLSTHLGNGIASPLARHPNPIWEQAAIDELAASFIADGHHLDRATFRVLVRAKGPERTILISDASPLAGLPPGRYGDWAVDPSGKIVVAGTPYLAGSNRGLEVGLNQLLQSTDFTIADAIRAVTHNPARLLGRAEPCLEPGQPANLVIFRHVRGDRPGFQLLRTCVDGVWVSADLG